MIQYVAQSSNHSHYMSTLPVRDIWQLVILSLIIKRTRIKALVEDKRAAMEAFGTYVEVGWFVMHLSAL